MALSYPEMDVRVAHGVLIAKLNRPRRFNALNLELYSSIVKVLKDADRNDAVRVVVLTGEGSYYCSGNDLSNFAMAGASGGLQEFATKSRDILFEFVDAFISFGKPLIGAVNGPAVGVAVTTLGLCDLVLASESATFETPFTKLGQSPEGVSSLIFPRLMGTGRATEMLLMGKQFTAHEACEAGLVSRVLPAPPKAGSPPGVPNKFREAVWNAAYRLAQLPPKSVRLSKQLIRGHWIEEARSANFLECELLTERWASKECQTAIMEFMTQQAAKKRSKL